MTDKVKRRGMALTISTPEVRLDRENQVVVDFAISATGGERESYTGAVSVAQTPITPNTTIRGSVTQSSPDQYSVRLDPGLEESDLPATAFITVALNDGTQQQLEVELVSGAGPGGVLTVRNVGIAAGVLGAGVVAIRLLT